MGYIPFPATPLSWTMRTVKGSALTHVELDDNQKALNQKINDTEGLNIGAGFGVYYGKFKNPNDGQLLFKSFIGLSGVCIADSSSAITISSCGDYCELADGITVQKVKSCDCTEYQIFGECGCGTIGLRNDGVTFNPNSANKYTFPCYDGPVGYHLCTDGLGQLSWCAGGSGSGGTSGDTYIANVNLTSGDTICITRSDGFEWCISLSAVTPYEYGAGFHSIQPRKDRNYANATSSNIGGGSGNTVYDTGLFSNIGGGQENDIYTKQSFIGGGRYNLIHALPTIVTGSTSATTSWTGITYSGLTFSACTGGTWTATTYVESAHTGTSFTEYTYSAVTFNSNHSSIVGGKFNKIYGPQAFIGGGEYNEIYSFEREIFGATIPAQQAYLYKVYSAFTYTGITPALSGGCSGETYTGITYSGITDTGYTNTILVYSGVTYKTSYSAIVGGERNTVHSYWSLIGGGSGNTVTTASTKAIIVGGHGNRLQETQLANIVGGAFNLIESPTEGFTGTSYNTKLSSIVGGYKNQLFSTLTFIGGGSGNTITSASTNSLIVGGVNNLISAATQSVIVGGDTNRNLGGDYSLIGGGRDNVTDKNADYTFVGGGRQNKIIGSSSDYSNIVGGYTNLMTASTYTSVLGGVQNVIHDTTAGGIVAGYVNKIYNGNYSIIGGGASNIIEDNGNNYGIIGGGSENKITGSTWSVIVGGHTNWVLGGSDYGVVGGGNQNIIDGTSIYGFIGGGAVNKITTASQYGAVVGGRYNLIDVGSSHGFIGAGEYGTIDTADWALIGGGAHNSVISNSDYSGILVGSGSSISESLYATVGGGVRQRVLNSSYSNIVGGDHNTIMLGSSNSFIGSGARNFMTNGDYSNIVGGHSNTLSASTHSSVLGGRENTIQYGNYSVVGGGYGDQIRQSIYSVVGGGQLNWILGGETNQHNVIGGGLANRIGRWSFDDAHRDFIGGGQYNKLSATTDASIVGGAYNHIRHSTAAFIGSGWNNKIIGDIAGIPTSNMSFIGAGLSHIIEASKHSNIVGGRENLVYHSEGSHIGGGSGHTITNGTYSTYTSLIGGGRDNVISASTNSFIGGGDTNLISTRGGEGSVIVGGTGHIITASQGHSTIVGGLLNKITGYHSSFIGGGLYNQILGSAASIIGGGGSNRIYSTQSYNAILGGGGNQIGHTLTAAGYAHNDQQNSVIVGGDDNKIFWKPYQLAFKENNFIGGGQSNRLTGTTGGVIVGGDMNKQYDPLRSFIGAGEYNYFTGSSDSIIVGGSSNILSGSTISFIGGGYYNRILGRGTGLPGAANYANSMYCGETYTNSSIVGGYGNTIYHHLTEGGAAILNGKLNTILNGHDYSVIMGGKGLTSDRAYTTFMNGLDVDTNAADGSQQSFKYHGTLAQQGFGRFLKDFTGAGDAQWAELPIVPTDHGGCNIISAWTVGCTLYMFASGGTSGCTGTTITADTCGHFLGPYRWKGGIDSISTTLPLDTQPFENIVTLGARYSNIQGGLGNLIDDVHFSGILNGSGNTIMHEAIYSAVIGTRDRTALLPETTYTRGIDADTDGVDGVDRPLKYHGNFANQGVNRFLKDFTGGGDAKWVDLPIIPTGGDCPVVSAWTQGCILYLFTSGSTSGCTGTTITANTCDNITGPYMWKGGNTSISTTLPLDTQPFENIITLGARHSNIQGGLGNYIWDAHFGGILNGSGNTIMQKAIYSAVIGTRDRVAFNPETTYTRGIDANTDGVDGINRHFRYHGTVANPGAGKVLTCINGFGDAIWDYGGGIDLSGNCSVVSAYTDGCILYMVTNCTGATGTTQVVVNGNLAFTADTCGFEQGPYVYKGGNASISTRLPGVGAVGENYINPISPYSNIDGGYDNRINIAGNGMSGIFSGYKNIIGAANSANTEFVRYSTIGGGNYNEIHGEDHHSKFIGGGWYNIITGSTSSIIGAGYRNRIEVGTTASGIFTGRENRILQKTVGVDALYAAILNGSGNTIGDSCQSSAIIGSNSRTATQSQTTYLRGLDALTNSSAGDKKFKYHGNWASPGLNYILTDSDGFGNAQWRRNTNPGVSWTGDCAVVSAYTTGCTLFLMTNCTGSTPGSIIVNGHITYTANTCNTYNDGPYEYGSGPSAASAIQPKLNNNLANGFISNITGGLNNRTDAVGNFNTVVGGIDNAITGHSVSLISMGHRNRIYGTSIGTGYSTILNGFQNTNRHQYSTILNGMNVSTTRDHTVFAHGLELNTTTAWMTEEPFRYYGTTAQEGPFPGKVLTDIDGLGNARWMPGPTVVQLSGCPIVSAYTVDCLLYLINCTGGTITANTCTTFGNISPYEYGAGVDSIKPILSSLQTTGDRASIGGGLNNHINLTMNGRIGGGYANLLSGDSSTGIFAGQSNVVTLSTSSIIGGGNQNTIGTTILSSPFSIIGAGIQNDIIGTYGKNFIGSGESNKIGTTAFAVGQGWSNIVGGYGNKLYGAYLVSSSIVGGWANYITGSSYSFIGGGSTNKVYGSAYGYVGGGIKNKIDSSVYSLIGGGSTNTVQLDGNYSSIVGGSGNTIGIITSVEYSNIQGGEHNTIGGDWPVTHASIVNGKDNIVQHSYSVIMGGRGTTSNRTHTTFVSGLDANSLDADGATKLFRYHGAPANPGLNFVLTDSTGLGDAVWSRNTNPGVSWTGDCAVVSAYTEGCTLYMMTDCTGTTVGSITVNGYITYTADTCNSFTDAPYKYGEGPNSIRPTIDNANIVSAFTSNVIGGLNNRIYGKDGFIAYTAIGSGTGNKIHSGAVNSSILAGVGNRMGRHGLHNLGQNYIMNSTIVGGNQNFITGTTLHNIIVGGSFNKIYSVDGSSTNHASVISGNNNWARHEGSAIIGSNNITTDKTWTTFTRGLDVNSNNLGGGTKYLKYHGTLANPTVAGHVLTDVDGFGNAIWAEPIGRDVTWTGDCAVVSAYTSGCTLYMVTNCTGATGNQYIIQGGNIVYTANTCNTFNGSPYEYRTTNSISTVLPQSGTLGENYIGITGPQYNNIQGGRYNEIHQYGWGHAAIGGGYGNIIGTPRPSLFCGDGGYQVIAGGYQNLITPTQLSAMCPVQIAIYDGILGGRKNEIVLGGYGVIGGGNENIISGVTRGFIGGGESNHLLGYVDFPLTNEGGDYSGIVAGLVNEIRAKGSFIGAGAYNKILGPNCSLVTPPSLSACSRPDYSAILNGSGNTISNFAKFSAIVGSANLTAVTPETTYMRGVDVMTEGATGSHLMRYHGSSASPGLGRFLMDVSGAGDAVWRRVPGWHSWTGDCGIVSAYTSNNGCLLTLVNCTGGTVTADTCSSMSGPYTYRGGSGSISTTLPISNAANENLIGPFATNSNIDGGLNNKIYTKGRNHSILGGLHNRIGVLANSGWSMTHHVIVGGSENTINGNDTHYSIIGGGYSNLIYGGVYNGIFSGRDNDLTGSTYSILGGGTDNQIKHSSWSIIAGGGNNILADNNYTFIGGGADNKVINGGTHSSIVGGSGNTIGPLTTAKWSNIQGGENNTVGGDAPVTHASIVNGKNNLVEHDYSAILGSKGRTSDKTNTTFVTGLDAQTNDVDGVARYFKYHGALSNNGAAGQVLTDVMGTGEATWQPLPVFPNITLSGCAIVSAYTTNLGCDLNLVDCTGGTYTVDICSTFNQGPYRFGAGVNAIEPVLNNNLANGLMSNITGGLNNRTDAVGNYNSIVGGIDNVISGRSVSLISMGHHNRITGADIGTGYSTILNGFQNINRHQYSTILNGLNVSTTRNHTVFANGLELNTTTGWGTQEPFRYFGTAANPGINQILTDIDGLGNARWMPCSTACSGVTAGLTGTTKHVDIRDYTANVKETISHGLVTEDVVVNVWTENKQKIDAEIFYVNVNQIEVAVSMDLDNVKTVIIG